MFVSGTSSHGVETYGVDGITIGSLTTRNTGECGILLNATMNAVIGSVDAEDAGTVTGRDIRIASRSEFAVSSDITFQNLKVINGTVRESPCSPRNRIINLSLENSTMDVCDGTAVGIREEPGDLSRSLDRITARFHGSSLILRARSGSSGRRPEGGSLLTVATPQGRVVHAQVLPDAGVFERRIDLEAGGPYVLSLANGGDKAIRILAAR
jgi:hypothetical protein